MPGWTSIPAGRRRTPRNSDDTGPRASRREVNPGGYRPGLRQRQRGDRHGARGAGLPGRRGRHRDGRRHPGPVPADARAGHRDGHRGAGLHPGRVHLRPGILRRRGLQPEGLADQPDPDHQGRRGGVHRVGPAGRRAPAGRAGAGGGGDIGVGRPDDLYLDGQAARGLPGGRRRDPGDRGARRGWTCGTWPGWPGRSTPGRGPKTPAATRTRRSRTGPSGWRPRSTAPGS